MAFAPIFQRPFSATFDRRAAVAAAAPWWLSGGVAAATCLAAYTPKGKASLELSYNNDAAPGNGLADGTYDAAPGFAPTFDAATGWKFDGINQYLTTGVTVYATDWTMLVRYSNAPVAAVRCVSGVYDGATTRAAFFMDVRGGGIAFAHYSTRANRGDAGEASVVGIAANQYYLNGTATGATWTQTATAFTSALPIGSYINNGGAAAGFINAKIQAVAIYNTTLTSTQVGLISTAMAAL